MTPAEYLAWERTQLVTDDLYEGAFELPGD